MRVRLTCDRCGDNWFQNMGDVLDLNHREAMTLIQADQAEAVDESEGEQPDSSNFKRQRKGR